MKFYTIKLEDKAAVLNRLKAAKVKLPSFKIHDNEMNHTFNIFIENPEIQSVFEKILNGSPRIDVVNKQNIKEVLRKMVRRQLQEWKLQRVNSPGEAQPFINSIEQALINRDTSNIEIGDVGTSYVYITIYPSDLTSKSYIGFDASINVLDYPDPPDDSVGYGGSDGSIKLEPDKIEILYYPDQPPYKGEDTTNIISLLNEFPKIMNTIHSQWLDALESSRYDYD